MVPSSASLLTIEAATEHLGISEVTLCRWDASGEFMARRHPSNNNYRVYTLGALPKLREEIRRAMRA